MAEIIQALESHRETQTPEQAGQTVCPAETMEKYQVVEHKAVQLGATAIGIVDHLAKEMKVKRTIPHDPAGRTGNPDGDTIVQNVIVLQRKQLRRGADNAERNLEFIDKVEWPFSRVFIEECPEFLEMVLRFTAAATGRPLQVLSKQRLRSD